MLAAAEVVLVVVALEVQAAVVVAVPVTASLELEVMRLEIVDLAVAAAELAVVVVLVVQEYLLFPTQALKGVLAVLLLQAVVTQSIPLRLVVLTQPNHARFYTIRIRPVF
jgi:hypothetical protein